MHIYIYTYISVLENDQNRSAAAAGGACCEKQKQNTEKL